MDSYEYRIIDNICGHYFYIPYISDDIFILLAAFQVTSFIFIYIA